MYHWPFVKYPEELRAKTWVTNNLTCSVRLWTEPSLNGPQPEGVVRMCVCVYNNIWPDWEARHKWFNPFPLIGTNLTFFRSIIANHKR